VYGAVRGQYSGLKVFTFDRGPVSFEAACSAKIKVQNSGESRVRFGNKKEEEEEKKPGYAESHVTVEPHL
jgi:hypothetical protein